MRRTFLLCLALAATAYSQTAPTPEYSQQLLKDLAALRDAALADDYAYRQVAHLSDNIGPRPSGSPQAEGAAHYVAEELSKLGLDARLEEASVPHWMRGAETAELVEYPGQVPGTTQKVVVTALGGNVPTPADGITAEVVVVTSFDELKALGKANVEGKIVLYNTYFDKHKSENGLSFEAYEEAVTYRVDGPKAAAALGAVASLVRSVGSADFRLPHTGYCKPGGIPAGAVTSEDAGLIARLAAEGKVRMHLVLTSQNGPTVTGHNVVADIKGSEHPEQVVVVSGHLDSWDLGTGALDDGAGVAIAMQTAQLIQKLGLKPKRTIRVIAWTDEENSAGGRTAYTKAHSPDFANYVAAFESDAGSGHALGFRTKVAPAALPWLLPAQAVLASIGANLIEPATDSPGADISDMSKAGVPAFGLLPDRRHYFDYHHTAADTLDKVVPAELREDSAAVAVMVYAVANLPAPLPR